MDPYELQKLMDCCRPDGDDLAEPELTALGQSLAEDAQAQAQWERTRQWDRSLQQATRDVTPPAGLAQRLLAALETEQPAAAADQANAPPPTADRRIPAARWTAAAISLCAVAAALAVVMWFGPWNDPLTETEINRLARNWVKTLDQQAWRTDEPPTDLYPIDPSLRFLSVHWQRFRALGDERAVAYRAALPPDRSTAYLLVIRTRQGRRLPNVPPAVPQSTTEGVCIGAWKSRGLLYVLLVPGDALRYGRAVNSQAFAMRRPGPAWQSVTARQL